MNNVISHAAFNRDRVINDHRPLVHPVSDIPLANVISIARPSTFKPSDADEARRRRIGELEKIKEDCARRLNTTISMICDLKREQ